jgi:hypothetical protein
MQYVQAMDLRPGDQLYVSGISFHVADVTMGCKQMAAYMPTRPHGSIVEFSLATEVLIEDRVPAPPAPAPEPEPKWYIKYNWHGGSVSASLMHGDAAVYTGPWRGSDVKATDALAEIIGQDIGAADRGSVCAVRGCDRPRLFHSTICDRPHHWRA